MPYVRIIPMEELKQRDVAFWLPPGGKYNSVWADTWVILAEIEARDSTTVLDLLADADVGGYIATPSGRQGRANDCQHLYVDRSQYDRAVDVMMLFLRGKGPGPDSPPELTKRPAAKAAARASLFGAIAASVRPVTMKPLVQRAILVAAVAIAIALGIAVIYLKEIAYFHALHHVPADTHHTQVIGPPP